MWIGLLIWAQWLPTHLPGLSAAADPISTNPFAQLGVSAVLAICWFVVARELWKEVKRLREENASLQESRIEREMEFAKQREQLANEVIPMLRDMAALLTGVPEQIDRTLEKARDQSATQESQRILRAMSDLAVRLDQHK